jgi:hypothetical protein
MHISFNFLFHFVFSFVGFLCFGIYVCRGSWRNSVRTPLALGAAFIILGHVIDAPGPFSAAGGLLLVMMGFGSYFLTQSNNKFVPSEIREGHNVFSLLVGAALFALTVQLHSVLFGVPVFQLVR